MIINIFQEENIKITFFYAPIWEMFFSMHVLGEARHHIERAKWVKWMEGKDENLVERIRELNQLTDGWMLVIDSDLWGDMRHMEIPEAIDFLRGMSMADWNNMTSYYGKAFTRRERETILCVIIDYYNQLYQREEMLLRPFLLKILKEEVEICRQKGLWKWCEGLHARLMMKEERLVFQKNREYAYMKKEIHQAFVSASTFLSPHLWLYERYGCIDFVKRVQVEEKDDHIPEDYLLLFKALADSTRLKIIREIMKCPACTKELAVTIGITEAAVSKHLKLLWEAKVLLKYRRGNFMEYEFNSLIIDYIPYFFYELMMH